MDTDRALIEQVRSGSPAAFERVYRDTREGVYGLLLTATGRVDLAEELLQETYARFLARMNGPGDPPPLRNLRAYLLRIARNLVTDETRRVVQLTEEPDWLESCADSISHEDRQHDESAEPERALRLLRKLPAEQREVIVLRLYNELSFREIAGMTGAPVKTLESRYRYGLAKLRSLWNAKESIEQ